LSAEELADEGVHVYSTDEKMALQALEHTNPKQTMKPGQAERIDPVPDLPERPHIKYGAGYPGPG